jgi:ribose 1,5-bisphosphokinase
MRKSGLIFLIVGNSGSGKDSLIKSVMEKWPKDRPPIKIPQRYITRPPHETEPFISVSVEEFQKIKKANKFLFDWFIYDIYYGVPREVLDWVNQGHHVLINVSRNIIPQARQQVKNLKVIFVYVPFDVTQARVKSRAREKEDDPQFKERVERAKTMQDMPDADFIVDNSGALEIGAQKLLDYLLKF